MFLYTRVRAGRLRVSFAVGVLTTVALATLSVGIWVRPQTATAAAANTINFQARLETNSGSIAQDGNYNVRFKLYNVSSGGTALWTESYLVSASQGLRTANGYLTVNLGSITSFPSSISWGQQLYLTMEIGGTGSSPAWDGEMSPRLSLTSVPSAFALNTYNGSNGFSSSLSILQPTGGNQTFQIQDQGAAGTYNLCVSGSASCGFAPTTGGTGYIQNQSASAQTSSNFWISGTGKAATALQAPSFDSIAAGNLNIGTTNATSITLGKSGVNTIVAGSLSIGTTSSYGAITIANGSWLTSLDSAGTGYINVLSVNSNNEIQVGAALNIDGGIVLPTDGGQMTLSDLPISASAVAGTAESYTLRVGSTNALTVYGEADGAGNAQNVRVAIGSSINPAYTLDVGGTGRFTGRVIGADAVGTNEFATLGQVNGAVSGGSGNGNYIQNQNSAAQSGANFWISGTGKAAGGILAPTVDTITAGALGIGGTTATSITIGKVGVATTVAGNLTVNGTASFGSTVQITGDLQAGNQWVRSLSRSVPTTVGDAVDIGNFSLSTGARTLDVSIAVASAGFSVSKRYIIPVNYNMTANAWQLAQPLSDSGAYASNDFALDVNVSNGVASLRIRRVSGATAGTAYVTMTQAGNSADAFTASSTTATVTAPTASLASTNLTQTNGSVGIGTTAPGYPLHVVANVSTPTARFERNSTNYVSVNGTAGYLETVSSNNSLPILYAKGTGTADLLNLVNSSSTVLVVKNGGNVGIGTTGPNDKLDISGSAVGLRITDTNGYYATIKTDGAGGRLIVNRNGTDVIAINSSNNVGIGTTGPGQKLDVQGGNINTSGSLMTGGTARINSTGVGSLTSLSVAGDITLNSATDVSTLNPGASTFGSIIQGSLNAHLIMDIRNNDARDAFAIRYSAANNGTVDTVGLVFNGSGSLGVGTTNPGQRLDVQGGNINTSGNLMTGGTARLTATGVLQNVTTDAAIITSGTIDTARISGAYTGITAVGTLTSLTTSGVITSTVATGTAPFTVASTTVVNNLNADLLDGLDSSSFCQGSCLAGGTATGDLTGTYPNPTIAKLQGSTLTINTPVSGNILQFNGTAWVNQSVSGAITLTGAGVAAIANGVIVNANLSAGTFGNITGTGALSAGSIASGFGTISTSNTITGTTLNGTTGINTGAGAGTQRISSTGALVNITTITASGNATIGGTLGVTGTATFSGNLVTNSGTLLQGGYNAADASTDNMLVNGDFERNNTTGWLNLTDVVTGGYTGNYAGRVVGSAQLESSDYIPVDPTRDVLQLEAYIKKSVAGTTPGIMYFGYKAYTASKTVITTAPCGSYCYFAASGTTVPVDGNWHKYSATTTGEGTTYPNFPVGTKYVRVLGLINYNASADSETLVDHVTLRRVNNGPLFIGNNFSTTNQVDHYQQSQLYTLSSGVLTVATQSNADVNILNGGLQIGSTVRVSSAGAGYLDSLSVTNNVSLISGNLQVNGVTVITNGRTLQNVTYQGGTIGVGYGGTGQTSFTQYGILFGNNTGALGTTTAGTSGQCLVATTGGAPTWGTCAGSGSGVTLQAAYNNGLGGTTPEIVLDSSRTTLDIQAYSGQTADLLDLRAYSASGLGVLRFGVAADGSVTSASSLTVQSGGANITGGINNNSNGITNTGSLTGVTGITTNGAYTQSGAGVNTFTGALNSTNTITGTTLNGTTGINTGAGAGTQRIDASGNLVNINNLNTAGSATIGAALNVSGSASIAGTLNMNGNTLQGALLPIGPDSRTFIAGMYNLLNNATKRSGYTVTQSGSVQFPSLDTLFDGNTSILSASGDVTAASPTVVEVTWTTQVHPQTGGVAFGWNSRYWNPKDFTIEAYTSADNVTYAWETLDTQVGYTGKSYYKFNNLLKYVKGFRITVTDDATNAGIQLGELFFSMQENATPYQELYLSSNGGALYGNLTSATGKIGLGVTSPNYSLEIKPAAGNAALNIQNSAGSNLLTLTGTSPALVMSTSGYGIFYGSAITNVRLASTADSASSIPLVARGISGQTADLFQVRDNATNNSVLFNIGPSGNANLTGAFTATSTLQGTRLISTVATGTAPLTVASTTVVANLNADMVDGLHATDFAVASGSNNYIQNTTSVQSSANFNISGSGVVGTTLTVNGAVQSITNNKLVIAGTAYANNQNGGLSVVNAGASQYWETYLNLASDAGGIPRTAIGFNMRDASNVLTSSVEAISILSGGNVGVGTTTPGAKLDINGTLQFQGTISGNGKIVANTGDGWLRLNPNGNFTSGIYATSGIFRTDGTLQVGASGATLSVASGGNFAYGTSTLFANTSGNVGIGTASPSVKLDVASVSGVTNAHIGRISVGALTSGYGQIGEGFDVSGSGYTYRYNDYASKIDFTSGKTIFSSAPVGTAGTAATFTTNMTILNTGEVGIGNTAPKVRLQVSSAAAAASMTLGGTAGVGFTVSNGDTNYGLNFGTNTNGDGWIQAGRLSGAATAYNLSLQASGGNVGIGTTTPGSYKLNVQGGDVNFSGALTVGGNLRLTGVSVEGGTDWLVFRNLATYSLASSTAAGAFVIETNVTSPKSVMTRTKIEGYFYDSTSPFEVTIGTYFNTTFANRGYVNVGGKKLNVRLARNITTGKVVIILGDEASTYQYPKVTVTSFMEGHSGETESDATGWNITQQTDLSNYDNGNGGAAGSTVTVPDVTAVPAAQITAGTFGTGNYQFNGNVNIASTGVLQVLGTTVLTNSRALQNVTTIDSTGAATLGTSATGATLTVGASTLTNQYIKIRNGGGAGYFGLDSALNSGAGGYTLLAGASKTLNFAAGSDAWGTTPQATLLTNGNFGIGTTLPGQRLDVQGGSINTSGDIMTAGTIRLTSTGALQNVTADTAILTSGTLASARLSGSYTGVTTVGTLTGLTTSGVIISTVATGTAPLTVASTTLVTNLNADMVDGLHASSFAAASGSSSYIQNGTSPQTANFNITGGGTIATSLLVGSAGSDAKLHVQGDALGTVWTARAAAQANAWRSVTYGNGRYVAVSSDGTNRVMTSTDGITWTPRTAAAANQWYAVTYGNGLFVAVAINGTSQVMTSPDGITWTSRTAGSAGSWYSVTYGNGLFVAVATSGTNRVMTSTDGITWTARSATEANQWTSVTYGNGLFVAVSVDGTNRVMTSTDGITWTASAATEANLWYSVAYGNGLFVAVSANGTNRVMTSPDGITWTARSAAAANNWVFVTYGNGLFVAVAQSSPNQVQTSPDGVNWTVRTAAEADQWASVVYGNGLLIAVASTGTNRVMTSAVPTALRVNGTSLINVQSATAFQVQDGANNALLTADTIIQGVGVGVSTPSTLLHVGKTTNTSSYPATQTPSGYYCTPGDVLTGTTCTNTQTYAATYNAGSYSCPSGGTLSGTTCTYTYTASYQSAYYYCPSGGTLSGTTCNNNYAATYHSSYYTCDSGGTLSGSTCTQSATPTYSCPGGGTLQSGGLTCYKTYPGLTTSSACTGAGHNWEPYGGTCWDTYASHVDYSCPSGWTLSGSSCTKAATYHAGYYDCPSGGTLSGTTCYSSYAASYQSAYYYCPSGGSLSGTTCTYTYTATLTGAGYTCPNGGTLSGTTCYVYTTYNASASTINYYCAPPAALSGADCIAPIVSALFEGRVGIGTDSSVPLQFVRPAIAAGNPGFDVSSEYATPDGPYGITNADVNGDGNLDLITTGYLSSTVGVLLNKGNGKFAAKVEYATGSSPWGVVAADFNGDNDIDLATVNYGASTISVLLNNGDGTFAAKVDYATGSNPRAIAFGNVDSDSDIDIVVANYSGNTVSVFKNNGSGTFAAKVDYAVGSSVWSVAMADIDSDGDADIVAGNYGGGTVSVLKNNGDGTFATKVDYAVGNGPRSVVLADLDGDSDKDLAVVNYTDQSVSILKNNGDGTFAAKNDYSNGGYSAPDAIIGADIDGDGDIDLVGGSQASTAQLWVMRNGGSGSMTAYGTVALAHGYIYNLTSGDFNNDGKPDIAAPNYNYDTVNVVLNATDFPLSSVTYASTLGVNASDQNSVGLVIQGADNQQAPLFVAQNATGNPLVSMNTLESGNNLLAVGAAAAGHGLKYIKPATSPGTITMAGAVTYSTGSIPYGMDSADIDGDGDMDMIVANEGANTIGVFKNNGTGTFATMVAYTTASAPWGVAVADVDGDGDADVVVANYSSASISVLKNNGDGTFATKVDYTTGTSPRYPILTDVDGDGDKDVAVTNYGSASVSVLKNNGNGTFATKVDYTTGSNPMTIDAADLDGDGDNDLVVANYNSATFSLFKNNGDGTFATKVDSTTGTAPYAIQIADVDDDGKQDVVTANRSSTTISVFKNSGTATFTKTDYSSGISAPIALTFGDIDGDGDLDAMLTSDSYYYMYLLLNDGNGAFSNYTSYSGINYYNYGLVADDFNQDGKVDFAATSSNNNTVGVILNNTTFATPRTTYVATLGVSASSSDSAGLVIQGAANQSAHLFVLQDSNGANLLTVDSTGKLQAKGTITGGVASPDYAENIAVSDASIEAADVVTMDPNNHEAAVKATVPYDGSALGVISTSPGFLTNATSVDEATGAGQRPLALSGRVPVKVSTMNGVIRQGDYLTSSTVPGYAMKATGPGAVIGVAMADFVGTEDSSSVCGPDGNYLCGKVLMFINPSATNPAGQEMVMQGGSAVLSTLTVNGALYADSINTGGLLSSASLKVTGNAEIGGYLKIGGDLTVGGTAQVGKLVVKKHILSDGDAPLVAIGSAAGQDGLVTIDGTDVAGTLNITVKARPADTAHNVPAEVLNAGALANVTFNVPFEFTPRIVVSPTNQSSVNAPIYLVKTVSGWQLMIGQAAADGTVYQFDYVVVGSQGHATTSP